MNMAPCKNCIENKMQEYNMHLKKKREPCSIHGHPLVQNIHQMTYYVIVLV